MKMSESSRVCDKKLTVNNSLHEAAGSRPVTWTMRNSNVDSKYDVRITQFKPKLFAKLIRMLN